MAIFKRKKTDEKMPVLASTAYRTLKSSVFERACSPSPLEYEFYRQLRATVPIIDAAVYKLVRLTGGFTVEARDERFSKELTDFIKSVKSDAGSVSLQSFIDAYFEQLLCYGTAVAEMLTDSDDRVAYLYNAPINAVAFRRNPNDFRKIDICRNDGFDDVPVSNQQKLLYSTLNPEAGSLTGNSILHGLPFVSEILVKILNAVGANWERVGNVRFAVTYNPGTELSSKAYAKERAMQIAEQWGEAMKSGEARDFIAVGDVDIKVIGADNQVLDSEVPVRQILEQIVSKLGLPPFMLGLSWSTTERMSQQQADALTTELEHYRRILTPVIEKICNTHLRGFGYTGGVDVIWNDITLKDTLDEANAAYLNAKTQQINLQLKTQGGET